MDGGFTETASPKQITMTREEIIAASNQYIDFREINNRDELFAKHPRVKELYNEIRHTQAAVFAYLLECRDIEYTIPQFQKVNFEWKGVEYRISCAGTSLNTPESIQFCLKKFETNKKLKELGYNIPEFIGSDDYLDHRKFYRTHKNVVLKPTYQSGGIGITLLPQSDEEVKDAFFKALGSDKSIRAPHVMSEQFVPGDNYRIIVLNNQVVAANFREPLCVIGDGTSTLEELAQAKRTQLKKLVMGKFEINELDFLYLKEQGFESLEVIPDAEQKVYLMRISNLSMGGTTHECYHEVSDSIKNICENVTRDLGLTYAGIDIISQDIQSEQYVINEINNWPGHRIHNYPNTGESINTQEIIINYIFSL